MKWARQDARGQPFEHHQELDQQGAERTGQELAVELAGSVTQVAGVQPLGLDTKQGNNRHFVGGVQHDPLGDGKQRDLAKSLQRPAVQGIESSLGRVDEGPNR